jgi:HSP20 family protein
MLLTQVNPGIWDPFGEISEIRNEMERLFESRSVGSRDFPAVNLWANDQQALITAELPGMTAESLDISVNGNILTLEGHRKAEETNGEDLRLAEVPEGPFRRSIELPFRVNAEGTQAKYVRGVLAVSVPRAEQDLPKKIAVKAV